MAGCFGHTSFDLGLFVGSAVVSGSSAFVLPIPNIPSLAGAQIAAHGLAFSLTTTLGLASSNGIGLVIGN